VITPETLEAKQLDDGIVDTLV